jgi:hypothetical protein
MSKPISLAAVAVLVVLVAGLSLVFANDGVVEDDLDRNIAIPDDLLMELDVKVAYNDEDIFWRFQFETDTPHYFHDYLVYEDAEWVQYGGSPVGAEPLGLYEDRLTFLLDDGSVDAFAQYGGFITIVSGMRFFSDEADADEVEEILGEDRDEVRKFLPETRDDPADWRSVREEDELDALREQGYFLDLWHWRAHRSNPIGWSDDQLVFDYRLDDDGTAPFETNWDDEAEEPAFMFDPDETGQYAMDWDRLLALDYDQDEYYYLSEDIAVPFDPDHDWQNGDAIPRRLLVEPEGSQGVIFAQGIAQNGGWDIELQRALDTGYDLDDKQLAHLGMYDVAFAVHRGATGSRWHYVSFPLTLGLARDADIEAVQFDGNRPDWDALDWTTIDLFYPGQVGWDHVISDDHAGHEEVEARTHVSEGHSEEELAFAAVESEFRDDIRRQWLFTGAAWVFFVLATTGAVALLTRTRLHTAGTPREGETT